jgi:hypothetical protein
MTMTTPLYPTFRKRIDDATRQLIQRQVTPWAFLTAGPPFRVKQFDGREIAYQGIGFEGSPRNVFWARYIDPFLEALVVDEIAAAIASAKERSVDAKLLLSEVQGLLIAATQKTFREMAEVDRRLLGKGFPERIPLRSVEHEIGQLSGFISERVRCEVAMWKPKPRLEEWYERNKFWVWLVGMVVAIAGLAAKFL